MSPFSRRLDWEAELNPLTRALTQRRAAGLRVLDLTVSNPTQVGLPYPAEAIREALADPRALSYEPHPLGLPAAREAIAAWYAARGSDVHPDDIILTASTSEAYSYLFKLLADPGDQILVPVPSYPLFEFLARLESVQTVPYLLGWDGTWHYDPSALPRQLTERTQAVVVVSPNNPTGSVISPDEAQSLLEVSGRPVIADEVFADYPLTTRRPFSFSQLPTAPGFVLNGLSKTCALPQVKLGWIVLTGPPDWKSSARQRLELIADTYLSVATPVQWAAARLLALAPAIQAPLLDRIRRNHATLAAWASRLPTVSLQPVEAGWTAVLRVPATRSGEEWALELLRAGVLVQPGHFFDFPHEAYLVVSLLVAPDILEDSLKRSVGSFS